VWRSSPISSNRRMRTRLYGGVAGERGINIPRPYADWYAKHWCSLGDVGCPHDEGFSLGLL
ncbi:MAG TPA: hypothetical protein VLM37_12550, partial [Fibrobacteraceae bacterium]|nr:hypothetical protein [Fibrobacteraceae bacterium]